MPILVALDRAVGIWISRLGVSWDVSKVKDPWNLADG
jgi:hypothetical protein